MKSLRTALSLLPVPALALVLVINLHSLGFWQSMPEVFRTLAHLTGLEQKWTLFAPHPPRMTGWLIMPAHLKDGTEVDILTEETPTYEQPPLSEDKFANQRWGRLVSRVLREPELAAFRESFVQYLCNEWSSTHASEQQVESLSIYARYEILQGPYATGTPFMTEPSVLYEGTCAPSVR